MSKNAVAVLEPEVLAPGVEASWGRARQLIAEIGDWHKIIELGQVLVALKEEYFRIGQGVRSDLFPRAEKGSARPAKPTKEGWTEVVRRELGMTPQTALRSIDRGLYVQKVACVMEGDELEYETTKGAWKKLTPTPEIQEKAKEVLNDILAGANAGNAWAGFVGEVTRRGRHGTPNKAPTDHLKNLQVALTKMENSLKEWRRLKPEERAIVEKQWHDCVLPHVPTTFIPDSWEK